MTGALPYPYVGVVKTLEDDVVIAELPCSLWPAEGTRSDSAGETFDHLGECPRRFSGDLDGSHNLTLEVEGRAYRIVTVTTYTFVPHVGLALRRVQPGG